MLTRTEEVTDLVAEVAATAREHAEATDRDAAFPVAALDALRRTRLLGLTVPREYGGMGKSVPDLLAVAGALSRECMSVGMIFAMHCQQVAAVVDHGSEQLRADVLPRVSSGAVYLASVTTEAGSGGHLLSSDSELVRDRSVLRVERFAPVVTGGAYADGFLITMRAPDSASPAAVSLVYADRSQVEAVVTGPWQPMGMRATHSVPMKIVGELPDRQVVGAHGQFREIALRTFGPLAHLGWASCWLGTADGALARTVRLLRAERGRRNLSSDLLLRRLSRVRQRLDTVHALIQHASQVWLARPDDVVESPSQLLLNAVKITSSEQCLAAVDELVELVGLRHGYLRDSALRLERALRDLRSATLNYSNDRLHAAGGALVLMDRDVQHV
ncbi:MULTISPECIES: acyl-CoA dehydrogenase family protein [Amycolatopsis]|uniref:Acyl-CoA dehydrogenase n=1 Tax=Amycolatopsis bullii TaxID=941987 RepID=A0ABQ3KCH2_9PSEU|nr:acyl-CoA dehydrogenase family protein [Amycolatopsis bullii]GHG14382.1 acyl-CoA dehydrogenase [Amycolatopsis bullii]